MVRPKNFIKIISIRPIYLNGTNLLSLCLFEDGVEHCCRLTPSSNVILVQNFTLTRDHHFHLIRLTKHDLFVWFKWPCLRVVDPRSSTCSSIIRSASLFGKRSPISVIVSANVGLVCIVEGYCYKKNIAIIMILDYSFVSYQPYPVLTVETLVVEFHWAFREYWTQFDLSKLVQRLALLRRFRLEGSCLSSCVLSEVQFLNKISE